MYSGAQGSPLKGRKVQPFAKVTVSI